MDFRSLTIGAKIRIAAFFIITMCLIYCGLISVITFRDLQLEQLTINSADSDVYFDGANFSLFFIAGEGLIDSILVTANFIAYTFVMLLMSTVSALLLRLVCLRKAKNVSPTEYRMCFKCFFSLIDVELIASLIITKGGMLLAVVMFELPSAAVMWLIYLSRLRKKKDHTEAAD